MKLTIRAIVSVRDAYEKIEMSDYDRARYIDDTLAMLKRTKLPHHLKYLRIPLYAPIEWQASIDLDADLHCEVKTMELRHEGEWLDALW